MKRLFLLAFILFLGIPPLRAQSGDLSVASLLMLDSSVGKTPSFVPSTIVPETFSREASAGKLPYIVSFEGPPPHGDGPGLRFNTREKFYVYTDHGAAPNHFVPSGWMGDFSDMSLDMNSTDDPADGKTCIKVSYSAKGSEGAGWAGMYWQQPVNNWGDKVGGFNLKGMKQLTFWARGAVGGEVISEFKIGGIEGQRPDSDAVRIGPVVLTREWKKYVMDLRGADLSHISGGFAWSASKEENPRGATFYLDEIRFEK